jgi:hypothetical protein
LLSRFLYCEPFLAVLPALRRITTKQVRIADLANERFVLFYRKGWSRLFDAIMGMCSDASFSPRVGYKADRVQTVLLLVEAEESVPTVTAKVRMFWSNGVRFYLLQPMTCASNLSRRGRRKTVGRLWHLLKSG